MSGPNRSTCVLKNAGATFIWPSCEDPINTLTILIKNSAACAIFAIFFNQLTPAYDISHKLDVPEGGFHPRVFCIGVMAMHLIHDGIGGWKIRDGHT